MKKYKGLQAFWFESVEDSFDAWVHSDVTNIYYSTTVYYST